MNPRRWLLVVGVLVAAAIAIFWAVPYRESPSNAPPTSESSPETKAPAPATSASEVREKSAHAEADGSALSPESERTTSPDRDHDLHGRVVGPRGDPIAGATIDVYRAIGREYRLNERTSFESESPISKVVANAAGEFRVCLQTGRSVDLRVSAHGLGSEQLLDHHAGESVLVQLDAAATIEGRITRAPDGAPASVSRVTLHRIQPRIAIFETKSDPDGHYLLEALPPGCYWLSVDPTVESPAMEISLSLRAGEVVQKHFVVTAGPAVKGRVTDATTHLAIGGADVVGLASRSDRSTLTDADGAFVLRGFAGAPFAEVVAQAPGYGRCEAVVPSTGDGDVIVDLELTPGRCVRGRVVGGNGEPIEGAYVSASSSEPINLFHFRLDWGSDVTASDGTFEIRDLRADLSHALGVDKEGFETVLVDFPETESSSTVIDVGDVLIHPAAEIGGAVIDEDGRGLPDVAVRLARRFGLRNSNDSIAASFMGERNGRTDSRGRFRFADLSADEFRVSTDVKGRPENPSADVTLARGEVREGLSLVLVEGRTIQGTVTDPNGVPLATVSMKLQLEDQRQSSSISLVTDADGGFRFSGLPGGHYSLDADAPWLPPREEEKRLFKTRMQGVVAGTKGLVVALSGAVSVEGTVLGVDGAPAANALVWARDAHGDYCDRASSDAAGRFRVLVPTGSVVSLEARSTEEESPLPDDNGKAAREKPTAAVTGIAAGARDVVLRLEPPR
ncbi:MAG: carboxypeptidase regulatory-like domain-containing protein [Planctomycetes bacterium]|nr:carboxypeptidase regulatory-like domain-containing protein [Planctomycetota bacterium]MBI3844182.1 carboxypeptidase regulatory-like domain-containing protein [Planctomycetota bacterium]